MINDPMLNLTRTESKYLLELNKLKLKVVNLIGIDDIINLVLKHIDTQSSYLSLKGLDRKHISKTKPVFRLFYNDDFKTKFTGNNIKDVINKMKSYISDNIIAEFNNEFLSILHNNVNIVEELNRINEKYKTEIDDIDTLSIIITSVFSQIIDYENSIVYLRFIFID